VAAIRYDAMLRRESISFEFAEALKRLRHPLVIERDLQKRNLGFIADPVAGDQRNSSA